MNIEKKFAQAQEGIKLASKSFSLIWRHPILLIYSFVPVVLATVLHIFWSNINLVIQQPWSALFACPLFTSYETAHWMYLSIKAIGIIFIIFIANLAMAALTHQVARLLQEYKSYMIADLMFAASKKYLLLGWSIVSAIESLLVYAAHKQWQIMPLNWKLACCILVASVITLIWKLFSFFIVQCITLENNKRLSQNLWHSMRLGIAYITQIIGGIFWICIVASAYLGPLIIISFFTQSICPCIFWIVTPLYIGIMIILTAAITIFKTIAYLSVTKQNIS